MQNILRREWGFKGLATTDMVNGELMFLPVETIMGGLTMMANGQGKDADLKATWVYSEEEYVKNDARINEQLKTNMHYQWYAYAHSNLMNGLNASSRVIRNVTWWSATLLALGITFGVLTAAGAALYVVSVVKSKKEEA
jgi:beta-glucosidase